MPGRKREIPERRKPERNNKKNYNVESLDFQIQITGTIARCFKLANTPEKQQTSARRLAKVIIEKCKVDKEIDQTKVESAYDILSGLRDAMGGEEKKFIDKIIIGFREFI